MEKSAKVSVSKIFQFFKASDSVLKEIGIEISIGFGIGKKLVSEKVLGSVSELFGIEKVSDSVSEIFGIGKSIGIDMENI